MIEKSKLLQTYPTAAEVKAARESTGLSTDEIANLFGLSDGSAWRKKKSKNREVKIQGYLSLWNLKCFCLSQERIQI